MNEQTANLIIQQYVEAARMLRKNTGEVMAAVSEGLPDLEQMQRIWQERDVIYERWFEAAKRLKELPDRYAALAVCEIEKLGRD